MSLEIELDYLQEIKILLPEQQQMITNYKGLVGNSAVVNKHNNKNCLEKQKTFNNVQCCRLCDLSNKIKKQNKLLEHYKNIFKCSDYLIHILNLIEELYEKFYKCKEYFDKNKTGCLIESSEYLEFCKERISNYKKIFDELYNNISSLFIEKNEIIGDGFTNYKNFINDNLEKYDNTHIKTYELFFRLANVFLNIKNLDLQSDYIIDVLDNISYLENEIKNSISILKEELFEYFTSEKYLNNPKKKCIICCSG